METTQIIQPINMQFALRETEEVIKKSSKTFHLATRFLPFDKRIAIHALYAFCRKTDDLVDRQEATMSDLELWRDQVNQPVELQSNPILLIWARVRRQYQVNRRYEQELIDGVAMDLSDRSYQTWEDLQNYCYHVASTVGLLSIPIIGLAQGARLEQAEAYATQLGIALQLTNILRDIGEDASNGRVYLPEEDLKRFRLTRMDILKGVYDERFFNLMQFEIERARRLYRNSLPGIALIHRSTRLAVGTASILYQAILDQIEAIDYQVYRLRAHTNLKRKIQMLPCILITIARLKPLKPGQLPG